MRIISRTNVEELRNMYDLLIGWGTEGLEFEKRYNPSMYKLDYLINGKGENVGNVACGTIIRGVDALKEIKNKKICVIIYPNKEMEILNQVLSYLPNADTIMGRLLAVAGQKPTYSRDLEDVILLNLARKLNLGNFSYLDIGVCHPVIRNNTYLFYENGFVNGVLVEPNPVMSELAQIYRPKNKVLTYGASAGENGTLTYYHGHAPGLNTFLPEVTEKRGYLDNKMEIPVVNINEIIEKHFDKAPDILDIDTEGMDYDLLSVLDTKKYPIKILCIETEPGQRLRKLVSEKGYVHFQTTTENLIYVRKEEMEKLVVK